MYTYICGGIGSMGRDKYGNELFEIFKAIHVMEVETKTTTDIEEIDKKNNRLACVIKLRY